MTSQFPGDDTVLEKGRDVYGDKRSPLFVDGLHVESLAPAIWKGSGEQGWVLSNLASQQPLFRLLDGLAELTGEQKYREAAEAAIRYAFANLQAPNGLLYWGGHTAWDLLEDRPVGQHRPFVHELKTHQPYYEIMWRMNSDATKKLLGSIWEGHILDWSRLDYNRHASLNKTLISRWDRVFTEDADVPFPAKGSNLSFCSDL